MAAPATTGQLRTRIQDMQIGDYIVCNYQASNGAVGTFSNLGGTAGTEIPVTGAAAPNGTFYLIKVDKGLLIADRVVQHSISWDVLNAGKYIQGFSTHPLFVIKHTAYVAGGVFTNAAEAIGSSHAAPAAFNIGSNYAYLVSGTDKHLGYDFSSPQKFNYLEFDIVVDRSPKDFFIEGSSDQVNWETLYSRQGDTNAFWNGTAAVGSSFFPHRFFFKEATYRYFRIRWNGSNAGNNTVAFYNMKYGNGMDGKIRSITGGVACADANGNKGDSHSYAVGTKGWPLNNEWDKYLTGFPTELIQSGKSINDVFHANVGVFSWTQDTNIAGNTIRTIRGQVNEDVLTYHETSRNFSDVGFRPVFEYKEM